MSTSDAGGGPPPPPDREPVGTPETGTEPVRAPGAPGAEAPPATTSGALDPGAPGEAEPAPAPMPAPVRRTLAARLAEPAETVVERAPRALAAQSRRDFLLFAAGLAATAIGGWWLLPDRAKRTLLPAAAHDPLDTLTARLGLTAARREHVLDRALTLDDDVAEALYSKDRTVRTYARSEVTPLRNNYDGQTPGPDYLPSWALQLSGLASGRIEHLDLDALLAGFPRRQQVTRLVCVEGWSAIAWWGGLRFADLLAAYPPAPGARWAALRSAVNLDGAGRPDPYYVSIDLETARHPQTLLATHQDARPLSLAHGAPLRLLVPMKLGLKNIKAVTEIAYSAAEPADYWAERGYSKYDGL